MPETRSPSGGRYVVPPGHAIPEIRTDEHPFPMLFGWLADFGTIAICRDGEPVAVLMSIERHDELTARLAALDADRAR